MELSSDCWLVFEQLDLKVFTFLYKYIKKTKEATYMEVKCLEKQMNRNSPYMEVYRVTNTKQTRTVKKRINLQLDNHSSTSTLRNNSLLQLPANDLNEQNLWHSQLMLL